MSLNHQGIAGYGASHANAAYAEHAYAATNVQLRVQRSEKKKVMLVLDTYATDDDSTVIFTLHMDGVLLASGNKTTLEMLKGKLMGRFNVSRHGRRVTGAGNVSHP